MLKRLIAVAGLLVASVSVNAAELTYQGYTLDTDTNIVTGGGLNWLQWDETDGQSIDQALAAHSGMRLATNAEMAELFNAFSLGLVFDADENTQQIISTGTTSAASPLIEFDVQFVTLFGNTYADHSGSQGSPDPMLYASAFFGDDEDSDGGYNMARINDDFIYEGQVTIRPGTAAMYQDAWDPFTPNGAIGVALVQTVPIPAAGYLFMSALFGLLARNRLTRR